MFTKEELDKRFGFHKATPTTGPLHDATRHNCRNLADLLVTLVPPGRDLAQAMGCLEETMFWTNAGIARNGSEATPLEPNTLRTYRAEITIGMREGYDGPLHMEAEVLKLVGQYCDTVGLGVEVHFGWCVYTQGMEPCARISLINYPRFPSTPDLIFTHAEVLGKSLAQAFKQQRFTIVATDKTKMYEMGA